MVDGKGSAAVNCWDFPENEETLSVAEDFPEVSPLVWTEFGVTRLKPVFSEEIPAEVRKEIPKKGNTGMRRGSLAGCWENLFFSRCQENCPLGFPGKLRKRLTGWRKMLISDWRDSSTSSSHWTSSTKRLYHWLAILVPF